jgi:hypothetical protein
MEFLRIRHCHNVCGMSATVVLVVLLASCCILAAAVGTVRAPAYPLTVNHPFFSIWSPSDQLHQSWPSNGPNGAIQALTGLIRVDGATYRFMGAAGEVADVFAQQSVTV